MTRSYLYVPGDRPSALAKAHLRGADAIVVDLEDAVPPAGKAAARAAAAEFVADPPPGVRVFVRVNSDSLDEDIAAVVVGPGLAGIWVPKADPDLLAAAGRALTAAERRVGLTVGALTLVPLIETARGVLDVRQIAAGPRVLRLGIGEADLAGELGMQRDPGTGDLPDGFAAIRVQVVVASAAAGITAPVGPVETALRDPARLERTTRLLLRQGFRARSAIHPAQLETINSVFTPSPDEVDAARRVMEAMSRADAAGSGVAVDADGRFLDRAVVRAAAEVLSRVGSVQDPADGRS
ncbi:HpcH/HpaI aldolase/citrate lyase family protein [Virgisporangium ochraceum]|uniref:CoA ester lyase n=1 Tax=Virgisporangium ochraceum TaxID=65505 RepID=A0A8J4A0M3_9ACTN|nr:CoA ester lyase [Virgisporangium ochraceum]GIJ73562.1 CoA ester lyase [Virgisporangium ochraceum]